MRIDPTDPTVHPGSQHRLCGVLLFKTSTKCSASIIDAKIVAAKQGGATRQTIGQTCVQLCNNRPFSKLGSCFVKGFRGPEVRCRRINIIMKGGHFLARPRNRVSHLFKVSSYRYAETDHAVRSRRYAVKKSCFDPSRSPQ